jgi:hypothetical protein
MKGFAQNIKSIAIKNTEFHRVLYTTRNCQLVAGALKPKKSKKGEQICRSSDRPFQG